MNAPVELDSLFPAQAMDRRRFLVTGAAAGFALAAQPVCAQSVIHTSAEGLAAGTTRIPVEGGSLPVYHARPAGSARLPTVLVIQEIFGVHEHIQDVCRRLAHLGYLAVAPELYFRQGNPAELDSIPAILENIVARVPDAQVLADLDSCAAWATRQGGDPDRLAVTGFCWGGRITWLYAAHNPRLKAGVAWYGRLQGRPTPLTPRQPLDVAGELKAPVLGLYGALDQGIPVTDVEAMQAALALAGGASMIHLYPHSGHAFHADYRPSYNPADGTDGWRRLAEWFRNHL
ncbi:MAG: dienelactone hydrolase family protein [Rhodocyclaceae bacterium]|nr:dienelactone hydrolase family protein [Rhodocyclaceae bacterium]